MNTKQWVYVYRKIKEFFAIYDGKEPEENMALNLMVLYRNIMTLTEKTRNTNRQADEDIRNIMNMLFKIVHSLEVEGKTV